MAYKGKYKVKNKEKYDGDPTQVIYRSLLERTFMVYLDTNPSILSWQSEEIIIPYISPVDDKVHRYFPDFFMTYINKDDEEVSALIEIKPKKQTQPPAQPKKKHWKTKQRYLRECVTWEVNQAKWNAAYAYCQQHGYEFKILTEQEIRKYNNGKDIYKKNK